MFEQITYEVARGVATITLNRPERLNAWTAQMGSEVQQAFASAERDREVVAILLTGAGRGFCAGADLAVLDQLASGKVTIPSDAEPPPGDPSSGFRGTYSYPLSVLKPVIGAINGPCAGMALPIALACDVRFASSKATFSSVFARRGLVAEWGVSWLLTRVVGLAHSADILLSGRTLDAQEAERIGLVNRSVPHDELLGVARAYAEDLASHCSPASMASIKRALLRDLTNSFSDAERAAFQGMLESFRHPDLAESLASFAEKRAPKYERRGE